MVATFEKGQIKFVKYTMSKLNEYRETIISWAERAYTDTNHPLHSLSQHTETRELFFRLVLNTTIILIPVAMIETLKNPQKKINKNTLFERYPNLEKTKEFESLIDELIFSYYSTQETPLQTLLLHPIISTFGAAQDTKHELHEAVLNATINAMGKASDDIAHAITHLSLHEAVSQCSEHTVTALATRKAFDNEITQGRDKKKANHAGGQATKNKKQEEAKETGKIIKEIWQKLEQTPEHNRAAIISKRMGITEKTVRKHINKLNLKKGK